MGAGFLHARRGGRPRRRRRWVVVLLVVGFTAWSLALWRVLQPPAAYTLSRWQLEGMVFVKGGLFVRPPIPDLEVDGFWIDRTEVTEEQWARFLRANPRVEPPLHWNGQRQPPASSWADRPAVWMTLEQAQHYARWAGKRLPTALEWDWAARERRRFPWGQRSASGLVANLADLQLRATTSVGLFEGGRSPCGAYDMVGNVREWTATRAPGLLMDRQVVLGGSFRDPARRTEQDAWLQEGHLRSELDDPRDELEPGEELPPRRPLRAPSERTLAGRSAGRADDIGFRCVLDASEVGRRRLAADQVYSVLKRLGARDPIGYLLEFIPANRELRSMGKAAVPGLVAARRQLVGVDDLLVARIDALLLDIAEGGEPEQP